MEIKKSSSFKKLIKQSSEIDRNKARSILGFYFRSWKLLENIINHIESNPENFLYADDYVPSIHLHDIKSLVVTDSLGSVGAKNDIMDRCIIVTGWDEFSNDTSEESQNSKILVPSTPIGFLHIKQLKIFYDWLGAEIKHVSRILGKDPLISQKDSALATDKSVLS